MVVPGASALMLCNVVFRVCYLAPTASVCHKHSLIVSVLCTDVQMVYCGSGLRVSPRRVGRAASFDNTPTLKSDKRTAKTLFTDDP